MRRIVSTLLFVCCLLTLSAQELPDFDSIPLAKKEDFNEKADQAALQASNFLLATPVETESLPRIKATQYILKWMEGTPNYSFTIDDTIVKINKKGTDLIGLYLAAATKFCLENKESAKDANLVKLNTFKTFADYCAKSENNVKVSGELKKLVQANEEGKLKEYLKL